MTICVGSSCHIKGSRRLIRRFSELIAENGLQEKVALEGSFCMERCGEGMNWRVDDEDVTNASVEEAVAAFRLKVIDPLRER